MTVRQYLRAYALARTFGHAWARVPANGVWANHEGDTAVIATNTLGVDAPAPVVSPLDAPVIDASGRVVGGSCPSAAFDQMAVGWVISTDGSVLITVTTSAGLMVGAVVMGDGSGIAFAPTDGWTLRGVELLRHAIAGVESPAAALLAVAGIVNNNRYTDWLPEDFDRPVSAAAAPAAAGCSPG
jgi:hypothetical protein